MNATTIGSGKSFVLSAVLLIVSCDLLSTSSNETSETTLRVKFENTQESGYTITDILLMGMGTAGSDTPSPSGTWSGNILTEDQTIPPGEYVTFDCDIPNLHYSQFRLGVEDSNGVRILLHEQVGYADNTVQGHITHWGSHERTVIVTVAKNISSGLIDVLGYSDFAGIE